MAGYRERRGAAGALQRLPAAAPATSPGSAILAPGQSSPEGVAAQLGDDYDAAQTPPQPAAAGGAGPSPGLAAALARLEYSWIKGMFTALQILRVNGSKLARDRRPFQWLVDNRAAAAPRTRVALTAIAAPDQIRESDLQGLPEDQVREIRAFIALRSWDDPVAGLPRKGRPGAGALTPAQRDQLDYIGRRRSVATEVRGVLRGPAVGLQYGGRPAADPNPTGATAGSLEAEIWQELDLEGSASAVNTWDDQKFTWGKGWSAQTTLPAIAEGFFRADPGARVELLEAGFTLRDGRWLFVSLDQQCVLEQNEALAAFRDDKKFVSLLASVVEDPAHQQAMVDAQAQALGRGGRAGDVPATIRAQWPGTWTTEAVRFGAHCVHWGRSWAEVERNGPSLGSLIAWISRIKGRAEAPTGAVVVSGFASGTIRHFARGAAQRQMTGPIALPTPLEANTFYFQDLPHPTYWVWRPGG